MDGWIDRWIDGWMDGEEEKVRTIENETKEFKAVMDRRKMI